jgi:DNA-binding transcriptional MerR regulator
LAGKAKLYTLTEVSKRAGVSMPTLQRYKKMYQDRIPSVGEGRRQRYPKEAIAEIRKIKVENLKKRGRPRKVSSVPKGTGKAASKGQGLLTLSEIGRRTGISYPTLVRYVKLHLDRIPHVGEGRKRRFPVEAVAVFTELRRTSKRGRPKASATAGAARTGRASDPVLAQRIRELERAQKEVSRQLASVIALLKKPVQVTIRPQ